MKQTITLNETQLREMIEECIRENLDEIGAATMAAPIQQEPITQPVERPSIPNQINNSQIMQKAVDNGGVSQEEIEQWLGNDQSVYGRIARNPMVGQTYLQVLENLQQHIRQDLSAGYFGKNQEVITTIQKFTELLSYLHGAFEARITRMKNKSLKEGVLQNWYNNIRYPETNQSGVYQYALDQDGNVDKSQLNIQWMKDLQNELQTLLEMEYLHGPKTTQVTKDFISFLQVDKRSLIAGLFAAPFMKILKRMAITLAGITVLAGAVNSGNINQNMQDISQSQGIEQTTQTPQQFQTQTVNFNFDSAQVSQDVIELINNLPPGTYNANVVAARGGSQEYNTNLGQKRVDAMNQIRQDVKFVYQDGGQNVNANTATVTITPSNTYQIQEENKKKNIITVNESQLRNIIAKNVENTLKESTIGRLIGGTLGLTLAHNALVSVCDVLKINPEGPLGQILTSRSVSWSLCRAIGGALLEAQIKNGYILNENHINEGIVASSLGSLLGVTVVSNIMKTICKNIGIDPESEFGKIFSSRLVCMTITSAFVNGISNNIKNKKRSKHNSTPSLSKKRNIPLKDTGYTMYTEAVNSYLVKNYNTTLNEEKDIVILNEAWGMIVKLLIKCGIKAAKAIKIVKAARAAHKVGKAAYGAYKAYDNVKDSDADKIEKAQAVLRGLESNLDPDTFKRVKQALSMQLI